MTVQRRTLELLVRHPGGTAVLGTPSGGLPVATVDLEPDDTTVTAAVRTVRSLLDCDPPLVEAHLDFDAGHDDTATEPVGVLVVTEPAPSAWDPPRDLTWRDLGAPNPDVAPPLRPRLAQLLAEWRGEEAVPALRPAWARSGWYAAASAWIGEQLRSLGRPPAGPPEQIRHWSISAVMRTPTAARPTWFKAVFPLFHHEPAVTAAIHRLAPTSVAPVLARDDRAGWLLLDDIGADRIVGHVDGAEDAAACRALVAIQRRFAGREAELVAIGAPRRPVSGLAGEVAGVLADPEMLPWIPDVAGRCDALSEAVAQAAGEVAALGYPDTLVHGDFHPGNVVLLDGRAVIFDWSDAAIAHPLVDALTWSSWLDRDPERGDRAWRVFLDAWADVCPPAAANAARQALTVAAAAYHTVSYGAILRGIEPVRRAELADGLQHYVGLLDTTARRRMPGP